MKYLICVVALVFIIGIFVFLFDQNKRVIITKYDVVSENDAVVNGFKIVHLSDLHSTVFKNLIEKVRNENPSVIMITGDFVNDKGKRIPKMLNYIKELSEITTVYYITGNHERRLDCFETLILQIQEAGAIVLLDEIETIILNENIVSIFGIDENQGSFENYRKRMKGEFIYKDYSKKFKDFAAFDGFKVVLSHFPENFAGIKEKSYNQFDFDLMLSGHAHGGQFNLPFIGPVFSPGQGFFPKYARGEFGERPKLVVNCGMGNSEFPFRLFNHPEIVVINVKKK